jgi:hypothetical protein
MLDFIGDIVGEFFFEVVCGAIAGMFSGLFGLSLRAGPEMLSVVPRLPAGAGVLLAKGGR